MRSAPVASLRSRSRFRLSLDGSALFHTEHAPPTDGRYWLDFANTGTAGAVFQVYAGNRSDGPWTYTLAAGTTLSDYWSAVDVTAGLYALSVYGPNGFLRGFGGDIGIAAGGANPEVETNYDAAGTNLILHVTNSGTADCVLTLSPNRYSSATAQTHAVAAGQSIDIVWPLADSAHWYDLRLTSDHDKHFERRLAGHIETGQASTSDPAFSKTIS